MTTTRDLGIIKAIHIGLTPPLNNQMLWYDDNIGIKRLKYYDTALVQWVALSSSGGDKNETYAFTSQTSVTVTHTMLKYPSVTIINTSGFIIDAQVQLDMMDISKIYITFNTSQSGIIILN